MRGDLTCLGADRGVPPGLAGTTGRGNAAGLRAPKNVYVKIEKSGLQFNKNPKETGGVEIATTGSKNKNKSNNSQFVMDAKDICEFFGVTRATLSNWVRKGAPKEQYGKYDLRDLVKWRYSSGMSPETRKLQAEADLKEYKAEQEKIRLGVLESEYIKTAIVARDVRRLLTTLKRSLLAIGHDVATDLNALDSEAALEAKNIVDKRITTALEQMARSGVYGQQRK